MNGATIYHVHFHKEIKGKQDYYFGSVSAIYEMFSAEELGVASQTLYNLKMNYGDLHESKKCEIRKEKLIRKRKENK